jgi:hypothetical protein
MMWIVDPTQGRQALEQTIERAGVDRRLRGRVCLFSNSKPNADHLLRGVAAGLGGAQHLPMFAKPGSSLPAPDELVNRIADAYDTALVAIAD